MLSFNPSKVFSLNILKSVSVMPSHSVEPNMSSSSSPSDITLLSNRYWLVLKGDMGTWPSVMTSKTNSIKLFVSHSISPSMMSSFNPSKGPYLIPSVAHLYLRSQIYSSLTKFLLEAHSDTPNKIYSSFPKHYFSIQLKAPTWFHYQLNNIFQVRFIGSKDMVNQLHISSLHSYVGSIIQPSVYYCIVPSHQKYSYSKSTSQWTSLLVLLHRTLAQNKSYYNSTSN